MKTNKLMALAFFVAITIILTRFLSFTMFVFGANSIRVGFGHIPIILSGILFGPIAGAMVGAVSDFLGTLLFSPFPLFPGFTLTAALTGFIPGLLFIYFKRKKVTFLKTLGIVYTSEIICSILLNTLWLTMLYGISYSTLIYPRMISSTILTLVYSVIVFILYKKLIKISFINKIIK